MKDCTRRGELLFRWVCLVLVYSATSVDSLNWTAQPTNPTVATKGQDVSLIWSYTLTAGELTSSQTFFNVIWKKFNLSSSSYMDIANFNILRGGSPAYSEPNAPHIVVGRASGISSSTLQIKNVRTDDEGRYKIEVFVELSAQAPTIADGKFNLTVVVPPKIANVTSDQVICEGSTVTLSCNATGKPTPNITWTRVFDNGTESALQPVVDRKYVITSSNGTYRCTADNGVGDPVNRTVRLTFGFLDFTSIAIVSSSNPVNESGSFNMTCDPSGDPTPNIHWIKADKERIDGNILNFANISRNDAGQYRCEAANVCGSNTTVQTVEVYFGPSATRIGQNITVRIGISQSFGCPVDGNPEPTITWYNASGTEIYSEKTLNFPSTELSDTGCYTCSAKNFLGKVNVTHCLVVELVSSTATSPTTASPTTSKEDSSVFKGTLTIRGKDWNNPSEVKDVEEKFCEVVISDVSPSIAVQLNGAVIEGCEVVKTLDGSIIVDFVLRFNQSVSVDEVVAALKAAAQQGNFGSYDVDPESIKQTPSSPTKEPAPCKESLFKDADCDLKVIILVIFGVCGVILIACVVGGAIYYWVHKRNQCRKDPRIHSSDDQEALHGNQSGADENAYSQANGSYADSGPPSANGTDAAEQQPRAGANRTDATVQQQQVQGATPTKFTKKQKREEEKRKKEEEKKMKEEEKRMKEEEKKNKIDAEQNIPQYAVVDKSQKKKKKEVVEDACAQVYTSKKSKKKAKPGEMLYADLGEFKPREMPAVSVSPDPLPPIKRPPAYEETQYADITQYLKGNATLPDTNNSQGTEMTFANVDGGKEKPKDTANEGGNEEKPKETRM